jgi:hypothetical protein
LTIQGTFNTLHLMTGGLSGNADHSPSSGMLPLVYDDLRKLGRGMMTSDGLQTLSATALVHEAWSSRSEGVNFLRLFCPIRLPASMTRCEGTMFRS